MIRAAPELMQAAAAGADETLVELLRRYAPTGCVGGGTSILYGLRIWIRRSFGLCGSREKTASLSPILVGLTARGAGRHTAPAGDDRGSNYGRGEFKCAG